jgi:hypothetical protein
MIRALRNSGWVLLAVPLIFLLLSPADLFTSGGWLPVLHALHLLLAAGAVLFLFALGHLALRLAGMLPEDFLERSLLQICAGFFILSLAIFLMAAAGVLYPFWMWSLIAAVSCAYYLSPAEAAASAAELPGGEGSQPSGPGRIAAYWFGAFLAVLLLGSLTEALIPSPQSSDALAYNLAYARMFSGAGRVVFTPHSPFFFISVGYWEFFLTAIALFTPSDISLLALAQILHLVLGLGGVALGIVCLIRRLSPLGGREALALGLFGAVLFVGMRLDVYHVRRFPLLVISPKSDLFVAAMQVAGVLAMFRAVDIGGRVGRKWGILGGLLIGAASGIKLPAGLVAIGLGAGFALIPPAPLPLKERMALAGWAAVGIAAGLAPMLAKNFIWLGNPVYPLMASYFAQYQNPGYLKFFISGFSDDKARWIDSGARLVRLIFPSAPFFLLLAGLRRDLASRGVHSLLLSIIVSVAAAAAIFSGTFPSRYALFISAFAAVCAACLAGGIIGRLREWGAGKNSGFSSFVVPAAWALLFVLAAAPTHADNRLKRAYRTAVGTPDLRERVFRMNPLSRFQAGWPGRLPAGARPLTIYKPERLFAVSKGWFPVVAVESPELMRLLLRGGNLEKELESRGFTHVYFAAKHSGPQGVPASADALISSLRKSPPLWREGGYEMYALGRSR